MKPRILILQNVILHYRKALYNQLALTYEVTVLHSGEKSITSEDNYHEIITDKKSFLGLVFQKGVLSEVNSENHYAIIAMSDLHWVNNILAMFIHNKKSKFVWWGSWLTHKPIVDNLKVFLSNQRFPSIFYTQQAKMDFVSRGVDERKLFVANNTFHVEDRIECHLEEQKDIILFVGTLNKRKELDLLIKVFQSIEKRINNEIKLFVIGKGNEELELRRLVKQLGLDYKVEFKGRINDADQLANYYKRAIVSVSLGQAGLSVLQSFAYGVPFMAKVNAISGGEISNIVNNNNGILCEENIQSIEANLFRLCDDLSWSKELGKNAYDHYTNRCTIDGMAKGFINAINGA